MSLRVISEGIAKESNCGSATLDVVSHSALARPRMPPKNGNVSSMSQSHSREPSGVATPSRQKLAAITWSHDFTRAVLSRTGFSPVKRGQCQPVKSDERSVRDSVDEGLRRGQKGPLCPKSVPFALFAEKAIICGKVSFVQVIGEKNPRTLEPCGFQESGEIFSNSWCGRRDSNSYSLRRWNLNPVCLPISPRPRNA